MNKYPVYKAVLKNEDDGIFAISLVDIPATLKGAMLFKKENQVVEKFAIQNEEKHLISGVIMLANTPIFRRSGDFEYFVTYEPSTLALMAQKMLKNGFQNNVDLQHNGEYVQGVSLVELYIKDSTKGINPNFIDNIPDGSLMGTYKCENEDVWALMKSGELNGFSLAGLFSIEETDKIIEFNNQNKKTNTMSKLKEKLKALLQEFASIVTDKGVLNYEGELAIGVDVFDELDNPAADGEYAIEDKVIVVAEGKITEIREVEKPEEIAEEIKEEVKEEVAVEAACGDKKKKVKMEGEEAAPAAEEAPAEEKAAEEKPDFDYEAIKAEIEALKAELEAVKATLAELANTPAVEPITEQFEETQRIEHTGNRQLDNLIRLVNAK